MPKAPEHCDKKGADNEVLDFVRGSRLKIAGLTSFKKGVQVSLIALEFNVHLNGRLGTIAGYDDARKRWVVDLGDGLGKKLFDEANLKPTRADARTLGQHEAPPCQDGAEFRLASAGSVPTGEPQIFQGHEGSGGGDSELAGLFVGARVRIAGLGAGHEELNGLLGTLVEHRLERRRWVVALDGGAGKKLLREANLLASDEPGARAAAAAAGGAPAGAFEAAPGGAVAGTLRPGTQVRVVCLDRGSGGLERLNGHVGVCERCDFSTGRWTVVFADGSQEQVRPEHLTRQTATLRPGAYVMLHGLLNARHLNGMLGVCGKFDPENLRWEVHLETGERKSLKPENLAPQDSYTAPREEEPSERNLAATFEEALQSGEISWLDC